MPSPNETDSLLERPEAPVEDENPQSESADDKLAKRLEETVRHEVASSTTVAKLIADPEIQKILLARQQGKKVQVVAEGDQPLKPVETPKPSKNIEEMTNAELTEHLVSVVDAKVQERLTNLLKPVEQKLEAIGGHLQTQQAQSVTQEVEKVRAEHEDFDEYRPDMVKLNQANPGLSVEELYLVAKRRKGGPSVSQKVSTERPTSVGTRGVTSARPKAAPAPGRSGWNASLAAALERVPFGTEE